MAEFGVPRPERPGRALELLGPDRLRIWLGRDRPDPARLRDELAGRGHLAFDQGDAALRAFNAELDGVLAALAAASIPISLRSRVARLTDLAADCCLDGHQQGLREGAALAGIGWGAHRN